MIEVDCVVQSRDRLGEVPLWSPADCLLYWIDVRRPALHSYDPSSGSVLTRVLPEAIGSFCLHKQGSLLLALKSGIHTYDCDGELLTRVLQPEPTLPHNRLNDGDRIPSGTLYVVDRDWQCRPTLTGLTIPNSLAWSPDGKRMYFSDTQTFKIFSYDYDLENGA